jgi:hypothetical protein
MPLGDYIAIACSLVLIGLVLYAVAVDWRERRRQADRDRLLLAGRADRRAKSHRKLWFPR